jgi:hypothetical protein
VKFTRTHARALAAGAATTALYLAGGKVSGSRAVRGGSLLLLAMTATVGAAQASAVAKTTKKRLDTHIGATAAAVNFVANGGTVGGAITCSGLTSSGTVNANNGLATGGAGITTSGGAVNAGSGTMTCGALTASSTCTLDHIVMNGNINLSGFNANTANGYFVSGAPHRANLGSVTFNAAGLQSVADRADFIQNTEGTGAGWAS